MILYDPEIISGYAQRDMAYIDQFAAAILAQDNAWYNIRFSDISADHKIIILEEFNLNYSLSPPKTEKIFLRFVPYFAWGNRSPGEMLVWLRDKI